MATTSGSGQPTSGTAGASEPAGTDDVSELSYSNAGAELDAIIEEFETGVIDVDRLVDQLERATEIVDELDRRLRRTRMRVEELVPRLEGIGQSDMEEGRGGATARDDHAADEFVEVTEESVIQEHEGPPLGLF
jgi:exodeoxyribonuclease VII small subunit